MKHLPFGIILLCTLTGCWGQPKQKSQAAPVPAPKPATQPAASAAAAPAPSSANALANKTASYAQEMEAILSRRPATPTNPPAREAESVAPQAPEPAHSRPSGAPPATAPAAVPAPPARIESAAPSANRVAAVLPPRHSVDASNTPLIVPEGVETTSLPSTAPAVPAVSSDALWDKLARQIKDYPRDLAAHLDYQLMAFLQDRQTPDLSALAPLPPEDREVLTVLMDGLGNFRHAVRRDANMLLSRKIQPIQEMGDRLQRSADLLIPTLALCTRVEGFGVYEPIEPPRFVALKEHPVIVYCEVANFASTLNDKKQWETKLTQEAVLYTEAGMPVWQDKTRTISDCSRNRRHDFFIVKMIKLPANLTIGRYLLKVTVVDQQAHRVAESTAPIQVVAQ